MSSARGRDGGPVHPRAICTLSGVLHEGTGQTRATAHDFRSCRERFGGGGRGHASYADT